MTKQQRLQKERSENQKRLFLQSKFHRKTGERLDTPLTAPKEKISRKYPFSNESKIFNLKQEKRIAKEAEFERRKIEKEEKLQIRENRGRNFRRAKNSNGQPKLGMKIQDILEKLQKENSQ